MSDRTELTTVETVHGDPPWVFSILDPFDTPDEALLVPCGDGVSGWINRCTHQPQRFDQGMGTPVDGDVLRCPRHGSTFDCCTGESDSGPADGTTLPSVEVTVENGMVYLVADRVEFLHEGGLDSDDGPSSTSHIGF